VLLQPLEQRAGEVQDEGEKTTLGETFDDGSVDILNVLLENVIEVADGLVEVKPENESDRSHALPNHE
jgi:hypothetical protein